jgi:hypothetical protein
MPCCARPRAMSRNGLDSGRWFRRGPAGPSRAPTPRRGTVRQPWSAWPGYAGRARSSSPTREFAFACTSRPRPLLVRCRRRRRPGAGWIRKPAILAFGVDRDLRHQLRLLAYCSGTTHQGGGVLLHRLPLRVAAAPGLAPTCCRQRFPHLPCSLSAGTAVAMSAVNMASACAVLAWHPGGPAARVAVALPSRAGARAGRAIASARAQGEQPDCEA